MQKVMSMHKGPVQQGRFGAKMDVQLCNDGPVTIVLDSPAAGPDERKSVEKLKAIAPPTVETPSSMAAANAITLLLRPSGASTPLRLLQERGLRLCALKLIHNSPVATLAVVLRALPSSRCCTPTLVALARRSCAAWLVSEVVEGCSQEHFHTSELHWN